MESREKIERKNNREDSIKWDRKILELDSIDFQERNNLGFFPSPDYDLIGINSFKGLGYDGSSYEGIIVNNRTFVYRDFYVLKNLINEEYIGDKKGKVFFVIIVMIDFIDTINHSHMNTQIISRNHPDYLAQGYIKTQTNEILYCFHYWRQAEICHR